jgi:hypothetical protein
MSFPTAILDQLIRITIAFTLLSIMLWLGPVRCLRRAWRRSITRLGIARRAAQSTTRTARRALTSRCPSARSFSYLILTPAALFIVPLQIGVLLLLVVFLIYPLQALAALALLFVVLRG